MLFREKILEPIRQGKVKLAYRRWKRPTVKAGGTLLTAIGLLHIDAVDEVPLKDITDATARESGYATRQALLTELDKREGTLFRIRFHYGGDDPRIALRESGDLDAGEMEKLLKKLEGLDQRSPYGHWTKRALGIIRQRPAERAGNLAEALQIDKDWLKVSIRKLKNMGLTESLEVGYRLSPRGETVLDAWKRR
ncbi:hypothetical protein ACQKLP_12165 [Chitinophaga sp. NPDC101104]|uniref:hypothetical protein n=1 Tax=Chitinophaga sp. NPDC101104 TaxID=3390561 RepID=UPI003D043AD6